MNELKTIAAGDGLVARVREGNGPAVLWLHGYTLDSTSWQDMWARMPGYRHVGLDLPAHGLSAPIRQGDDLPGLARKVAAFCRREDIRQMVALSFGTLTATQVLMEEPEWFSAAVLGAPSLAGGPQDPDVGMTYARLGELFHRSGPGPHMTDAWFECIAWRGVEKHPELERRMRALVGEHRWSELGNWGMWRLLQPAQDPQALRRVTTPVLVLIGELDLPAFHTVAGMLRGALPVSSQVTLPGIGHLCMYEAPELSAGPVLAHLAAHARSAPAEARA